MVLVNAKLREAAPAECAAIDAKRDERRPLTERRSYVGDSCQEGVELARQILTIDAEISKLHGEARAKQTAAANQTKADALKIASSQLNVLAVDASQQQKERDSALKCYVRKLSKIGKKEDALFESIGALADATENAGNADTALGDSDMEVDGALPRAAGACTAASSAQEAGEVSVPPDAGDQEQPEELAASEPAAPDAPSAEGGKLACQHCAKLCKGKRGLASHAKHCRGKAGSEPAARPAEPSQAAPQEQSGVAAKRRRKAARPADAPKYEVDPVILEDVVQRAIDRLAQEDPGLNNVSFSDLMESVKKSLRCNAEDLDRDKVHRFAKAAVEKKLATLADAKAAAAISSHAGPAIYERIAQVPWQSMSVSAQHCIQQICDAIGKDLVTEAYLDKYMQDQASKQPADAIPVAPELGGLSFGALSCLCVGMKVTPPAHLSRAEMESARSRLAALAGQAQWDITNVLCTLLQKDLAWLREQPVVLGAGSVVLVGASVRLPRMILRPRVSHEKLHMAGIKELARELCYTTMDGSFLKASAISETICTAPWPLKHAAFSFEWQGPEAPNFLTIQKMLEWAARWELDLGEATKHIDVQPKFLAGAIQQYKQQFAAALEEAWTKAEMQPEASSTVEEQTVTSDAVAVQPRVCIGAKVELVGLERAVALNGKQGIVVGVAGDKLNVQLASDGAVKHVRPSKLKVLEEPVWKKA